jgi:hypothetical protein
VSSSDKSKPPTKTGDETAQTSNLRDDTSQGELSAPSSASDVDAFVRQVRAMAPAANPGQRGRLIFGMDATMSRQPTWDMALHLQAEMFKEVARIGGLDVQLVYFRGYDECRASKWVKDASALARLMTTVQCRGGFTQIRKILTHARREANEAKVGALVYVGDCMEEDIDELANYAGELGLLKVPAFMFQEGRNPVAESAFREIARLTGGAYCRFDAGAASQLRDLLRAVAVYAAGGRAALEDFSRKGGNQGRLLLEQLKD